MPAVAIATPIALVPDREQIELFVRTIFKNASSPDDFVSLRAFGRKKGEYIIRPSFNIDTDDFKSLVTGAYYCALHAMKAGYVFSPPIATFKSNKNAAEFNIAEGFTISVECDERPREALATLTAFIGPPTLVVESGGRWTNPGTGVVENKLHLHWVLKTPARELESLTKLKQARAFACAIVGADPSCVPIVHPMRWPGSWHMKDPNNPRLCRIIERNKENEIDLDEVFEELREIAPAEAKARPVRHARVKAKPKNAFQELAAKSDSRLGNIKTLTEAMQFIPNPPGMKWVYWNETGMALSTATGGSEAGFKLFDNYSKLSQRYNEAETRERWEHYKTSTIRIGARWIYGKAIENGWERNAPEVKPTQVVATLSLHEAREALKREIHLHFNFKKNVYQEFYERMTGRTVIPVIGKPVEIGVGKTHAAIEAIAASDKRILYCTPTIKVGGVADEIKQKLVDRGVDVGIFRGRGADDPDHPNFILTDDPDHENPKMCLDGKSVADAVEAMQPVSTTFCKRG